MSCSVCTHKKLSIEEHTLLGQQRTIRSSMLNPFTKLLEGQPTQCLPQGCAFHPTPQQACTLLVQVTESAHATNEVQRSSEIIITDKGCAGLM